MIPAPSILVTGATGLLGGALAADLLGTPEWSQVLLLARGEDQDHAHQRVVQSLARFIKDPARLREIKPEQVLAGDFTRPAAFIDDPRLAGIRRVVNCAALTSFGATARAFTTNVDGTLHFVHQLRQVAQIERFLHVSTAMICGDQPPAIVREDDYPRSQAQHLASYTKSKAEAERLLRLTLPGFPLVIVRPSIIVGHSEFGTAASGSIFWAFRMFDALGTVLGREDARIDVIPVDYAASTLKRLLLKPRLKYPSYHISAGPESACTWDEIAEAFAKDTPETGQHRGAATQVGYRSATLAEIEARKPEFDTLFGQCHKGFMMKAIKLHGAFFSLNTVFDTSRLREEGVPPSLRFATYLGACRQTSASRSITEEMMANSA